MESARKFTFFRRIKTAVFELEKYGIFLGESLGTSIRYMLLLISLLTIITTSVETYNFSQMVEKGMKYVENEMPDFLLDNAVLSIDENIEAYDEEFDFYFFADTDEEISDDKLRGYLSETYGGSYGVILLHDRMLYVVEGVEAEYKYTDIIADYGTKVVDKQVFLNDYRTIGINTVSTMFFVLVFIGQYLVNILQIFADLILVAILGHMTARICKIKLRAGSLLTLSIYAMTLSVILNTIYITIKLITGFVISYFNIMYLLIAYVYIVAAMLMIKTDIIKCNEELAMAIEMQKQLKKEQEEQEQEEQEEEEKREREKDKQKKKEKEAEEKLDREPDGSEI